jgi:2-oxoglutarate dehydrogenase E2 component (dihydrolipoamide succinyltransferase)
MITEIKVPSPGESITEVQIARWIKNDGDYVEKDEEIAEIDSDKATLTIAAEQSGTLSIKVKEGETVSVGTVVCTIDDAGAAPVKSEDKKQKAAESTASSEPPKAPAVDTVPETKKQKEPEGYSAGVPSPAAAKIMKESGMDASKIVASGKGGRITKADVLKSNGPGTETAAPPAKALATAASVPAPSKSEGGIRREKMSMLRKKLSQRLVAVKNETAMLTTFNEVDMSAIMEIRSKHKDKFKEKHGVGLGFMSFFTKAVCEAL